MHSPQQILEVLDDAAEDFQFPMLDNGHFYIVDARLSAFADDSRWALLIEIISVNPRSWSFDNFVYGYGNCLKPSFGENAFASKEDWEKWKQNHLEMDLWIFTPVSIDGLFEEDNEESENPEDPRWECDMPLRKGASTILIRDKIFPLPDQEVYAEAGVTLEHAPYIQCHELMRGLLPRHKESFVATEEEIRTMVPSDLPLLLRLDEWWHPDVGNEELPSESKTFQMIADVLVSRDSKKYSASIGSNTHWSNWPEGGTL